MNYLDDYGKFNPKTKLDAKTYVDNNYYALKQIMNIKALALSNQHKQVHQIK
jgi:hypothetical protein